MADDANVRKPLIYMSKNFGNIVFCINPCSARCYVNFFIIPSVSNVHML